MSSDRDSRLATVFSQVLGVPIERAPGASMETIPDWDSMAHINLILAVEQEFRVGFTPEEASEALSFDAVRNLIADKT